MDILEPHINSGLGVAFKADNGKYWSVIGRGDSSGSRRDIEAAKTYKDFWTRFTILKIDDNHIYLKSADGKYLSRIHRSGDDYIEAAKTSPDVHCVFQVLADSGKVMFKANTGKFLQRVYRQGEENIEAAGNSANVYTKFSVETGSTDPITEEIINVQWDTFNSPSTINPTAIVSQEAINGGSQNLIKTFTLEKTITPQLGTQLGCDNWG